MDDATFAWCLFQEADADGSGGLDRDEVKALARGLGYPLSAAELEEAMAEMDTDGSNSVEFDEFLAWFTAMSAGTEKTGWAQQLAEAAKEYAMNAMLGRDTGHKLQFRGGLVDRLKAAAAKRAESGRRFQVPHVIGLNAPALPPPQPPPSQPDVVQRTAASLSPRGRFALPPRAAPAAVPEPEPEPEPEPQPIAETAGTAEADAATASGLGSIAARWNAAAPLAFWAYPWDLSSMTAQLVSFDEQPKPEETPLERLSGAPDRALVVVEWSNGDVYEGDWSRGEEERVQEAPGVWTSVLPPLREQRPDGRGTHISADGSVYIGQWKLGQRHGQGRMQQACGDCYTGHFKRDKYHGSGQLEHANGSRFKGAFAHGMQHGSGTFTLPDGARYCADFKNGRAYQFRPYADGTLGESDYVEPELWQSEAKRVFKLSN
jgi:hypothetical protein